MKHQPLAELTTADRLPTQRRPQPLQLPHDAEPGTWALIHAHHGGLHLIARHGDHWQAILGGPTSTTEWWRVELARRGMWVADISGPEERPMPFGPSDDDHDTHLDRIGVER